MDVRNMVRCSLFAALMALCAWMAVPLPPVSVTLQTFGVLLTLGVLGGKCGCRAIGLYLLLGVSGAPVFAGFRGGASALLDATGGFLWGFLAGGLGYWLTEKLGKLPAMMICQLVCYACGCLWFSRWAGASAEVTLMTCVLPWLLPDGLKLYLAWHLSRRIARHGS